MPLPGGSDNGVAFAKRSKGAKSRRLHSTIDEAKGETQRPVPCVSCTIHLANWEGPEVPRPFCVNRGPGMRMCGRCYTGRRGCLEVPATALEKVKALEEQAKKTASDDDLVNFPPQLAYLEIN